MTRAIGVLYMLVFQLGNMYSSEIAIYQRGFWYEGMGRNYVSWYAIFEVIIGVSILLSYEKYKGKQFVRRSIERLIRFVCIGCLLIVICQFSVNSPMDEIIFAIGVSLLCYTPFLILQHKVRYPPLYFLTLAFLFALLNQFVRLSGSFNIIWMLSFFSVGSFLCTLRNRKHYWLIFGFSFITLSFFFECDLWQRTIGFWFSSVGIVSILLWVMTYLEMIKSLQKLLSYFGRHSLYFYCWHFLLFRTALLLLDYYKQFNLIFGLFLTFLSIIILTLLSFLNNKYLKLGIRIRAS